MTAKKQRRKEEPIILPKEEWHFEQCPEEEIESCYFFEYSRECARQREGRPGGDGLQYFRQENTTPEMDFPNIPYLMLDPEVRRRRPRDEIMEPETDETESPEDTEYRRKHAEVQEEKAVKYLEVWHDYNPIHATKEPPNWGNIWTIGIDWKHSNKKLADDFRGFIELIRPKHRVAEEARGKKPLSAKLSKLKQLGAYRLLESGYSAPEAMDYTKKIIGRKNPLYAALPDWSQARTVVDRRLSTWPPDDFVFPSDS